jgi:hypothetical protein
LTPERTRAIPIDFDPGGTQQCIGQGRLVWVQDEGVFDVWVGGSSAADLAGSFEVKQPSSIALRMASG